MKLKVCDWFLINGTNTKHATVLNQNETDIKTMQSLTNAYGIKNVLIPFEIEI